MGFLDMGADGSSNPKMPMCKHMPPQIFKYFWDDCVSPIASNAA